MATPTKPNKPNRYTIESVDRALVLLDTLASKPGTSAAQLAATLGANRSLVFRMLTTLAERGFVTKDATNAYRLGPRLLHLGQQVKSNNVLVDASREVLDRLLDATHENVYLIVRDGFDMICLDARISPQPVRIAADVGTKGGLHTGGAAKALLAFAPQAVIDAVLEKHLHEFIPAKLRTRKQVLDTLEKIRSDDFYEGDGEIDPAIYTATAPVRDGSGNVIAVIAVAAPTGRLQGKKRTDMLRELQVSVREISQQLGQKP